MTTVNEFMELGKALDIVHQLAEQNIAPRDMEKEVREQRLALDTVGDFVTNNLVSDPAHDKLVAAAPTMLEALRHAKGHLMHKARKDQAEQAVVADIIKAIAQATP